MNDLLIFVLIVFLGLIPFGFGVVYFLYKRTIVMPVALMVFISSMFCAIVAFAVSEYGFNSLYWAIPTCLIFLVSTNAVFKKTIQKPLIDLKKQLDEVAKKGNLEITISDQYLSINNEMGDIMKSSKLMIESLHKTADFANQIAKGDFENEYELVSDKDKLGLSLQNMRNSLVEAKAKENERKKIEEQQNWVTNGIAKFSDILRSEQSVRNLSELFLSNLLDYMDANQGGLFIVNDEQEDNIYYELVGCVAYDRNKLLQRDFKVGEGLVGRCAYERKTIYLTEVPENYVNITSGLGTSNPRSIAIVPAIINDKVYAIMELASFHNLEKYQIEFLEKIGENIASSISTLKVNEQTQKLLEESKQQSEELAAQEEEMRQNLEELQATQEEMQRKENELLTLTEELQNKINEQDN